MMKKIKELYSSPDTTVLVVRFEGMLMGSPDGYHQGGGGSYDGNDTNENGDF